MLIQKIERVNSMTIRKMANEELSQCVDVIRKSYETEAVAFGITEMNCPQHAAFITLDRLQMSAEWGYVFYGAFEDDELIACFAIENKEACVTGTRRTASSKKRYTGRHICLLRSE